MWNDGKPPHIGPLQYLAIHYHNESKLPQIIHTSLINADNPLIFPPPRQSPNPCSDRVLGITPIRRGRH